jgi:uncharacterized protein
VPAACLLYRRGNDGPDPQRNGHALFGTQNAQVHFLSGLCSAGFLLAVCSCTVIPLFAGIYKKGAGLGPAITFLFVAPAINILGLVYTGSIIGMDLAIARLVLSLAFGISIGIIMAIMFRKEDAEHDAATDAMFAGQAAMRRAAVIFLLVLVTLLVAGTFQFDFLKQTYAEINLPISGVDTFQNFLAASFRLMQPEARKASLPRVQF